MTSIVVGAIPPSEYVRIIYDTCHAIFLMNLVAGRDTTRYDDDDKPSAWEHGLFAKNLLLQKNLPLPGTKGSKRSRKVDTIL